MTPEEKLADLQRQCDAIWDSGKESPINCPYCYHTVEIGQGPCCDLLDRAIRAIIERAKAVEDGMKAYQSREIRREIMGGRYLN